MSLLLGHINIVMNLVMIFICMTLLFKIMTLMTKRSNNALDGGLILLMIILVQIF
jgi:hypothetical protein